MTSMRHEPELAAMAGFPSSACSNIETLKCCRTRNSATRTWILRSVGCSPGVARAITFQPKVSDRSTRSMRYLSAREDFTPRT